MNRSDERSVRQLVARARELRLCLSFPCLLDEYEVRQLGEENGWWAVTESAEATPVLQVAASPRCPRCGGELVPAPRTRASLAVQ